jgi:hypothetical protein
MSHRRRPWQEQSWVSELVDACRMAAFHANDGGAGIPAVVELERRVRAAAAEHGIDALDLVQELIAKAPVDVADLVQEHAG